MSLKKWNQKIWANLPVKSTARTRTFYKALGFKLNKGHDGGKNLASFLIGVDNFVIHFFSREAFKKGIAGGKISDTKNGSEILFTFGVATRREVDKWADKVLIAGGKLFQEPTELNDRMYNCGFADLDGHKWNILSMERKKQLEK